MLKHRVISALIAAPIFLLIVFLGDPFFQLLVILLSLLSAKEYKNIVFQKNDSAEGKLFFVGTALWFFNEMTWHFVSSSNALVLLFLFFFAFALYRIKKNLVHRDVMAVLALMVFGVIYCGFLIQYFYLIRQLENGFVLLLFLLLIIWTSDTSAYFVGRFFGKTPLHPQVSPKKTIEGSLGAIVGSLIIGILFAHFQNLALQVPYLVLLIILTNIAGQIGDLAESLIKRSFQVKDSGNILPGHGGILDRFDSIFFAAPIFYFMIQHI